MLMALLSQKLQKQPAPVKGMEINVYLPDEVLHGSSYRGFRLYLYLVFAGFRAEHNNKL